MAITVQNVYSAFCYDVCEDNGLVLGIVTLNQFYDLLNLVVLDFLKRSGLLQRIYTQSVFAGQTGYSIPDDIIDIQSVWISGRWLPVSTQRELSGKIRNWRTVPDIPRFYYTDGLPLQSLGLAPYPNYNSAEIVGVNYPNPPFAIYDQFWATCQVGVSQVLLNPVQHRGLTIIGTQKPNTQVAALTDPIPLIPDQFAIPALIFGLEERVFSADNELKDSQRARFCAAQFTEQINLVRAFSGMPSAEDQQ
jgi:hypothetical protein